MPEGAGDAELVVVGDELLSGAVADTNTAWLSRRLGAIGVRVGAVSLVADDVAEISSAVRRGAARAGTVVVTGGLGPTQDDLTREGLADATGVALVHDPGIEAQLRRAAAGRALAPWDLRMAARPEGARWIVNPVGAAPALVVTVGSAVVYALPGVPAEMRALVEGALLPEIAAGGGGAVLLTRVLRTAGIAEAAVAEALGPLVVRVAGTPVRIGFLAADAQVSVRVVVSAASQDEARRLLEPVEAEVRRALGPAVYGCDDEGLEAATEVALLAAGETVSVAESLTGGLVMARLTAVPGCSGALVGGFVTYATEAKMTLLGVPEELVAEHGVVSPECAAAMARGARQATGATYGLSLTGVAGPQPQEGKPVGTVHIGLATPDAAFVRSVRLPGDREQVRVAAAVTAVDVLRRHLAGSPADGVTPAPG